MAGDWIKVESATPDKPELVRMASLLGIDQDAVFGKLFRLWAWADQNIATPDDVGNDEGNDEGNDASVTTSVSEAFVDRLTFCTGFAKAMVAVGWLIFTDGGIRLPNFTRHNGETAKKRALTARRVAKAKAKHNAAGVSEVTPAALPKALPREEKRREESIEASARSPSAGAQAVAVVDGDGKPITSVIATLTPAQSATVVTACKALRKMGAIRFHPGDEALAALAVEGFTAEQIARCASEKALRDAGLWGDPDVHPDLPDLMVNGASQSEMGLTPEQYLAVKSSVTQVSIGYIASTLRGRRRDAATTGPPARGRNTSTKRPSATDSLEGKTYVGTAIDQLPPEIRAGFERSHDGPG